ncbi:MAG: restriction endonuclease subunit S [Acetatifactor sp.]|nr:restriction endonuclease subunit S [Acetatifactor sp.]
MREMKDSRLKWIGEIPSSWNVMPNKYLMKKKKVICPVYTGEDILSLTMKGVIVRDLDAGGKMPTSFDGYQRLEPGNLLMCLFDIDVTPRCIGLIKQAGLSSPAYSQFELNGMGNAEYYCYYYTMLDNDKTLLHLAKNLRHSLTEDQLGAISVIVPPVQEQKRIANFLDAKCAEIDALTADIQTQIDTLEQYKRSVITEAVTKGLNPDVEMKNSGSRWCPLIPIHWELVPAKYLFHNSDLRKQNGDEQLTASQKYGIITQRAYMKLENTSIVLANKGVENWKHVEPNDFIISLRSFQGGLEMSETTGCITWHYVVLKASRYVCYRYYKWLFKSEQYINALQGTCNFIRDGQDLRFSNFSQVPLLVPPIEEQETVADYLDQKTNEIDSIIAKKKKQLDVLAEYKKSLIYEYVTGKKEVPANA